MKYILCLCLVLAGTAIYAQPRKPAIKRVKQTEQLEIVRNETYLTTKYATIQLAKENAIKDAFGTDIYEARTFDIENTNANGQISSSEDYKSVSRSFAKGVWLETTVEDCQAIVDDDRGDTWVRCTVEGKVMEIVTPQYDFEADPMSCLDPGCKRTDFRGVNDFYLSFKSPVDGYVAVYLDFRKEDIVQFLQVSPNSSVAKVKADQPYIFFKNAGYELFTNEKQELDILYVIFSKTPFDKPMLQKAEEDPESMARGITFPKQLSSRAFEQWLGKIRSQKPDTQVKEIAITITST